MSEQELIESNVSILEMLKLSTAQRDALAAKFAKLPKLQKQAVRASGEFEDEVTLYAAYILAKMANDYISAQMRDIWIQRLEMLIPRLLTKDEKLKNSTEGAVAQIASEITDSDERANVLSILHKNMIPKSTDKFTLLQCLERAEELFTSAWKK